MGSKIILYHMHISFFFLLFLLFFSIVFLIFNFILFPHCPANNKQHKIFNLQACVWWWQWWSLAYTKGFCELLDPLQALHTITIFLLLLDSFSCLLCLQSWWFFFLLLSLWALRLFSLLIELFGWCGLRFVELNHFAIMSHLSSSVKVC